jgi:two-component system response regulator AtoC
MLDEIGEMPLALQAKLLHVLQDRHFTRLGSNRPVQTDVRVLAATNRELEHMIRAGTFREDLYYRLQVIEIRVPPLRERRDEIIPLVEFFLQQYAGRYGRSAVRPSQRLREAFLDYSWPGNVRELENVIKRFVILQDENLVLQELQRARNIDTPTVSGFTHAPAPEPAMASAAPAAAAPPASSPAPSRAESDSGADLASGSAKLPDLARRAALNAERDAIQQALDHFRWNRRKAAQQLGVSYKTLLNKMKECGISAPNE